MRILVTGASGFTASHLIPLLKNGNNKVFLTDLFVSDDNSFVASDLSDFAQVSSLLDDIKPDQIYHLAGSFSNDFETDYKCNVISTKNIFDVCLANDLKCRILLIGSAAEYGAIDEKDNPVVENHILNPVSMYGLTKTYQTLLMRYYRNLHNIDVVMARVFNLLGKGLSNRLFVGRLYEQIEQYKNGSISVIELGNMQNMRDYINVADAVKYYKLIMERGGAGEVYNVGSGQPIKIIDLLKNILEDNNVPIEVIKENILGGPSKYDVTNIYASIAKLSGLLQT